MLERHKIGTASVSPQGADGEKARLSCAKTRKRTTTLSWFRHLPPGGGDELLLGIGGGVPCTRRKGPSALPNEVTEPTRPGPACGATFPEVLSVKYGGEREPQHLPTHVWVVPRRWGIQDVESAVGG